MPPAQSKMIGGNLIGVVNEVHDALSQLDINSQIDLPQIAVVGSQSSGKSSVLESVVGRDFLPRGSGIVTRCPLVLKLAQRPPGSTEYGEFSHKPNEKFEDFSKICAEIEARTHQIAGDKTVSSTPISLTVYSPNVLNLTLIDLPGVVTTNIGNQPKDIERQIKEMVMNFIRPQNTIILAISPANSDLANSIALKCARSVDPEFSRTIGVLTKLDLMDQGTNAVDILENRVLPLRRGWIGVVNRSQKAINEKMPMVEAKALEREYFQSSNDYRHMADRMGTEYLAQTMSSLLLQHIQRTLPELRAKIDHLAKKTREKQESLGMLDESQDSASRLLKLINEYTRNIARAISGEGDVRSGNMTKDELQGGARLHYILYEAFSRHVQGMRAAPQLTKEKLRCVIRNSSGLQASFFPSNAAFLTLVREQISRLEDPALQCIQFVHEELRKITSACASHHDRYPKFKEHIQQLTFKLLEDLRSPAVSHMRTWIQAETRHINTHNPQLLELARAGVATANQQLVQQQQQQIVQGAQQGQQLAGQVPPQQAGQVARPGQPVQPAVAPAPVQPQASAIARAASHAAGGHTSQGRFMMPDSISLDGDLTPHEASEHAALREIVEGYFTVCKDTLCDQNPKIIAFLMVHQLEESINAVLMKALFKETLFEELLSENPQIAQLRKATARMMASLTKAQAALDKVRDLPIPE